MFDWIWRHKWACKWRLKYSIQIALSKQSDKWVSLVLYTKHKPDINMHDKSSIINIHNCNFTRQNTNQTGLSPCHIMSNTKKQQQHRITFWKQIILFQQQIETIWVLTYVGSVCPSVWACLCDPLVLTHRHICGQGVVRAGSFVFRVS